MNTLRPGPLSWAIASALAMSLAACGGGGSSGGTVTPPPAPPVGGGGSLPPPAPPPANVQPPFDAHLTLIGADAAALAAGNGGAGVTIGVLDSGVRRDHPGLAGRVKANFVHVSSDNDLSVDDKVGHGTTVALLAAGRGVGNWPGGVARQADIVSSRIIADKTPSDDGSGRGNEIKPGVGTGPSFRLLNRELADAGARIINNSWGGLYWSDARVTSELVEAYRDFVITRGGLVVFSNGNSGTNAALRGNPSDMAMLPSKSDAARVLERGWLTVAALNPTEATPRLTDYSQACGLAMNYCLSAPGNVVFPSPGYTSASPSYRWGQGTSYSAPLVSGAAALVWSAFPYFDNNLVRQTILGTATDVGAVGVDAEFGHGILNVANAVKGPGKFAWGDVSVNLASGNSVWGNAISGQGGLIKQGAGTLVLARQGSYAGTTQVREGLLIARQGLAQSAVQVQGGGSFQGLGQFGSHVSVATGGNLLAGSATSTMHIGGSLTLAPQSTLAVWLGNPLRVDGRAALNQATVHIGGIREGYVSQNRETLLEAAGGVSGRFGSLSHANNLVLINARLGYDSSRAYLETSRINVQSAASRLGLDATAQASASRIEEAMQQADAWLASEAHQRLNAGTLASLGHFQRAQGSDGLALSLRTLSGQLHGASAALTYEALEATRHASASQFAESRGQTAGSWARTLAQASHWQTPGSERIGQAHQGQMFGHGLRLGARGQWGMAFSRQQQHGWLPDFGDQVRGHQHEAHLYAGQHGKNAYWHGQLAVGQFERQMQRHLLLGADIAGVSSRLAGRYERLALETGYRTRWGGLRLTPYAGLEASRLRHGRFSELGAGGLGLRGNGWENRRSQGYLGVGASRAWQLANQWQLQLDTRHEWQQQLALHGQPVQASLAAFDVWQPLHGLMLAERQRSHSIGINAYRGNTLWRFDWTQRSSPLGMAASGSVQVQHSW